MITVLNIFILKALDNLNNGTIQAAIRWDRRKMLFTVTERRRA